MSSLIQQIRVLPHFTVTTFDMPGMSRTTCPPACLQEATGNKLASQVVGLLDKLGIKKTSAYGSWSGGIVAISLLDGWNDRIDRVVVLE